MQINEAAFAARIYAIERFTGEAPVQFVKRYKGLLKNYLNIIDVNGILNGDLGYEDLNELLYRAIDIAGAETDKGIGKMSKGKNLASVFSRLSITHEQQERGKFYRYDLNPLTPEDAFPCPPFEKIDNQQLLNEFYNEMDCLMNEAQPGDYHSFITCFDRISRKYMWCITASDHEGEDISLYDFMKVTEAIMVCLVKSDYPKKPFTLVMGDFSGIQKYIFAISSSNNTGVARRLRARSFFVDIVNVVFSQYIADCFEVEYANILLQSGGKFYCMVPTLNLTDEKLSDIKNEFDKHLFEKFHGSVSVNLAWLACSDDDIKQYSDSIVNLNELQGKKKAAPFGDVIKSGNTWNTDKFVLYNDLGDKHICEICGMELIDKEKNECDTCKMQLKIGEQLPRTRYILFTKTGGKDVFPIFKNYGINLLSAVKNDQLSKFNEAYLIEALNSAQIDKIRQYPCITKYMANHIPTDKYRPKNFSEIAEVSDGVNKIAVLKADVDVLGFLFAQGLRTKERHFGTISRVNTMSRMLEVFFCGYVEHLLETKQEYKDVYSVFSGGDDLFLLGPWNVMLDLSAEVRKKFKEFTAQNESVTLSAAVSVFAPKEHIAYMAEYSESQLNQAKNKDLIKVYSERIGRNAICVLGDLMSWEDFEQQLNNANQFVKMLVSGKGHSQVSVSIFRRIAQYGRMYRQYLDGDTWQLMFAPMFSYDRERNYSRELENDNFMKRYIASLDNAQDINNISKNLYFAETAVKIALNKTRRERN